MKLLKRNEFTATNYMAVTGQTPLVIYSICNMPVAEISKMQA